MEVINLQTYNGAPPLDDQWRAISVHECEREDYDEQAEDKILICVLITMKHSSTSSSKNIKLRYGGAAQNSNSKGSKFFSQRTGNLNSTYDRLLFFADLCTPGKCFAVLTETPSKSDMLMTYCKQTVAVGDIFAIIEPDQVVRALKGNVPLVNTTKAMYPLVDSNFASICPILEPEVGQQRYFYLKHVIVELTKIQALAASCNGTLCDRQSPFTETGNCGCLYFNRSTSIVLDMTVTFRTMDINGYESSHSVQHFRSWRTTKVFIYPMAMTADTKTYFDHTREIREVGNTIKNIVNANGGWNIVGWCRKGEVVDASADQNDAGTEISSGHHPIHISYLYPADPSCLDLVEKYPPVPLMNVD